METPLTLHQVAELLGVHYQTVFRKRYQIGFRLPGGRRWYVLPSTLANFMETDNNLSRLEVQIDVEKEKLCQSLKRRDHPITGLISHSRTAKELDALLEPAIKS